MQAANLKREVWALLKQGEKGLAKILNYPPRRVINPLIAALLHREEEVRTQAIKAIGQVVARLAEKDMESARIIMRRFMWMLNEESGGIGWGVPQAMAESMVCSPALAKEYLAIFLAYIWEDGNYLEFTPIQREVLRGVLRLVEVYPELLQEYRAEEHLRKLLSSPDPAVRALAERALSRLRQKLSERKGTQESASGA